MNNKLKVITNLFEEKEIRSVWNEENEEYYFSVVDVISALTNAKMPRNYWSDLKRKLIIEGSELHEKIVQLKLKSNKDNKSYLTDTLNSEGIFRLIEVAKENLEKKINKSVISKENNLNYKYSNQLE